MTAVVSLTQALIGFNTVNPPGNEAPAVEHLGRYLRGRGLQIDYQQLVPGRLNLLARIPGREPVGHLVLTGHMDVVHPGEGDWDVDPFAGLVADGRVVGRGAADMKGGVAAMAVAVAELAQASFKPRGDLILAITAGEEVDMAGARLLVSAQRLSGTKAVIVGEPTGLDVFIAEKGILWVTISVHGKTAHGSMPQLGVNAVSFAARLVLRLEEAELPCTPSPILGDSTLSVNILRGGVKTNVVPDRCDLTMDLRLIPGQEQDEILARVEELIDSTRRETGLAVRTELRIEQSVPAVETNPEDEVAKVVVAAAESARGSRPRVGGVSYGTDGAILAPALGASLTIFGPGKPSQAHQPNEYVEVEELEQAVEAYKAIARQVLS